MNFHSEEIQVSSASFCCSNSRLVTKTHWLTDMIQQTSLLSTLPWLLIRSQPCCLCAVCAIFLWLWVCVFHLFRQGFGWLYLDMCQRSSCFLRCVSLWCGTRFYQLMSWSVLNFLAHYLLPIVDIVFLVLSVYVSSQYSVLCVCYCSCEFVKYSDDR